MKSDSNVRSFFDRNPKIFLQILQIYRVRYRMCYSTRERMVKNLTFLSLYVTRYTVNWYRPAVTIYFLLRDQLIKGPKKPPLLLRQSTGKCKIIPNHHSTIWHKKIHTTHKIYKIYSKTSRKCFEPYRTFKNGKFRATVQKPASYITIFRRPGRSVINWPPGSGSINLNYGSTNPDS